MMVTDDALIKVIKLARKMRLSKEQIDAERQLALIAWDSAFYDMRAIWSLELKMMSPTKRGGGGQWQQRGGNLWYKFQDKLSDACLLIKEGDDDHNDHADKYKLNRPDAEIKHDDDTMYINVRVEHSAKLINYYKQWQKGCHE
jgi:hypothetical protein